MGEGTQRALAVVTDKPGGRQESRRRAVRLAFERLDKCATILRGSLASGSIEEVRAAARIVGPTLAEVASEMWMVAR